MIFFFRVFGCHACGFLVNIMRFISSKYIVLLAAGAVRGSVLDPNCDSELVSAIRASHETMSSGHLPDVGKLGAGLVDCPESFKLAFKVFIDSQTSLYRELGEDALKWLTAVDRNKLIHDYVARRGSVIVDTTHLDNSGFWTSASDHFDFWGQEIGKRGELNALESADIHVHIATLRAALVDMGRIENEVSEEVQKELDMVEAARKRERTVTLSAYQASNLLRRYTQLVEKLIGQAADLCAIATDYNEAAMEAALRQWGTHHWLIEQLVKVLNLIGKTGSNVELTLFVNEYLGKVVSDKHQSVYRKYNQLVRSKKENAKRFETALSNDAGVIHDLIVIGGKLFSTIDSARIEMNRDEEFSNAKALALGQRIREAQAQAHDAFDVSGHWLCASMRIALDAATENFEKEVRSHPIHEPRMKDCQVEELICIQTEGSADGTICSSRENLDANRSLESVFETYVKMVLDEFKRSANNRKVVWNQEQALALLRKYLVAMDQARLALSVESPNMALPMHRFLHKTLMKMQPNIDRWVNSLPLALESGLDASVEIDPLLKVRLVKRQGDECKFPNEMVVGHKQAVVVVAQQQPVHQRPSGLTEEEETAKEAVGNAIYSFFQDYKHVNICTTMMGEKRAIVDCFGQKLVQSLRTLNDALSRGGGDAAMESFKHYQGRSINEVSQALRGGSFIVNIGQLNELTHIDIESLLQALVARGHPMKWEHESESNLISITFQPENESSKKGVMGYIKSLIPTNVF